MSSRSSVLVLFFALTALTAGAASPVRELVVSPDGLTPAAARDRIRAAKAAGETCAWNVRVKPGRYVFTEPLVFTAADSGTPEAPVRWIGEAGSVFTGAERLTDWRDDGDVVWSAPAPRRADGSLARFGQLWVNGRRAPRSVYPKTGYLHPSDSTRAKDPSDGRYPETAVFTNESLKAVLAPLAAGERAEVQMLVRTKWAMDRRNVLGYDAASNVIFTACLSSNAVQKSWNRWANSRSPALINFENVRTAFTDPGDWFYDAAAGRVRYRPLPGETLAGLCAEAPVRGLLTLLEFAGASGACVRNVSFESIAFEGTAIRDEDGADTGRAQGYALQAAFHTAAAVEARFARNVRFDDCVFRHTGGYGIRLRDGCMSNTVANCVLEDLGSGGIWAGRDQPNPDVTLTREQRGPHWIPPTHDLPQPEVRDYSEGAVAFITVTNCIVRGTGRTNAEGIGVCFGHCSDSKIVGCDLHDLYYTGVSLGWVWGYFGSAAQRNEVAYCRIWDVGKGVMSDMGGVYTLGASHGTVIHHNIIHDVRAFSYGGWAMYNDEGSEGVTWHHNLCYDCSDGLYHLHYGRNNIVRNNIMAFGGRRLLAVGQIENHLSVIFENNILYWRAPVPLFSRESSYGTRDGSAKVWYLRNVYWCEGDLVSFHMYKDFPLWRLLGNDLEGAEADPLFVDAAARDFRLKPESPALAAGYDPWDFATAGARLPAAPAAARSAGNPWAGAEFFGEQKVTPLAEYDLPGVKAVMIRGSDWKGAETRVFAYYGLPDGASVSNRVPAMVLVHGGLGTAHEGWVRLWTSRGYAAIAMDTCGALPVKGSKNTNDLKNGLGWLRHRYSGPQGWGGFASVGRDPLTDHWTYHAVGAVIRSHSFLRSLPEVDPSRVGLTGISWGGYLTCIVAGVDGRFAFAAPVYGAGRYDLCTLFTDSKTAMTAAEAAEWLRLWDPANWMGNAKCPFLFADSNIDFAFPLKQVAAASELPRGEVFFSILPGLGHNQGAGAGIRELGAFADYVLRDGARLVRFGAVAVRKGVLATSFEARGRKAVRFELVVTTDPNPVWKQKKWTVRACSAASDGMIRADLPDGWISAFVNAVTDDGLVSSTKPVFSDN